MCLFDDLIKSDFTNNKIFRYDDDLLPASFEVNLTYHFDENINYNVTVRLSDYFNVVFYNLTFFDYSKRKYEYEAATYNFNNGYLYNYSSYNHSYYNNYNTHYKYNNRCYYSKINYDISHPIVSFINMLWDNNKDKIYQSSVRKKEKYDQIFEIPVDNGTHVFVNITRSAGTAPKINSAYGMFLDNKAMFNLTSNVKPRMFSIRNLYPELCWPYAYGRQF